MLGYGIINLLSSGHSTVNYTGDIVFDGNSIMALSSYGVMFPNVVIQSNEESKVNATMNIAVTNNDLVTRGYSAVYILRMFLAGETAQLKTYSALTVEDNILKCPGTCPVNMRSS